MKKVLYILFITSISLSAQERKSLYGKVLDSIATIENAYVINLQTNKVTYTNFDGDFKIFAKIGDSLKVTSVQYQTQIYHVNKVSFGFNDVQIFLRHKTYQLEEVELRKNNLLGYLDTDVKQFKNKK